MSSPAARCRCSIVENDRARRLTLRIDSGGRGLRITVPPGLARGEVDRFLQPPAGLAGAAAGQGAGAAAGAPGHQDAAARRAASASCTSRARAEPSPSRRTTAGRLLIVHGERAHLPRRLADFLKREAKRDIEALVEKHTAAIGKRAKAIRFRDTSSRWGSCTSDGKLSFSWRIMMAPPPVINYLVAHEVAHLKEMNHGPKFWKLCEELCPDTERCKAWLKRNGGALQAIQFE